MAEPIPSAGPKADADDETQQQLPANAEDRKAAAALNALNANEMSQENGETPSTQRSAADQEALGKAMSRLEIAGGGGKKKDEKKTEEAKKKEVEVKKKVKIAAEDVNFLVCIGLKKRGNSSELIELCNRSKSSTLRRTKPLSCYGPTMETHCKQLKRFSHPLL